MSLHLIYGLAALLALVPLTGVATRQRQTSGDGRDGWFWLALAIAILGPGAWAVAQIAGRWLTDLATALWVTIVACLIVFGVLCRASRSAWRLGRLLLPYLLVLAALAVAAQTMPQRPLTETTPGFWIDVHIVVSVVTYALVTVAAVAALAGVLQERALKAKQPNTWVRRLPAVAESEALQVRLLTLSEAVLGAGLLSGMAVLYYQTGAVLRFDHKTLFSTASFVVIAALLLAHGRSGVRGRAAARFVLAAYLLLTLAYIGVKFVRDVVLTTPIGG